MRQELSYARDPNGLITGWIEKRVHPEKGYPICGGKTRKENKYGVRVCLGMPVENGNGRCRMHNGRARRGFDHPRVKTGRYSKYIPNNLKERYESAVNDPDILALNDEIALFQSRIAVVIGSLDTSTPFLKELGGLRSKLLDARGRRDANAVAYFMENILDMIARGEAEAYKWSELMSLAEMLRRLTDSERKRRETMQHFVTAEDQMSLVIRLADLVKTNVSNKSELQRIIDGLLQFLGDRAHQSPTTE